MKKILVLFNPASHKATRWRHLIGEVRNILSSHGNEVEWIETEAPGQSEQIAHQAHLMGYDIVVAMGGDGTVNEIVNGLAETEIPIGVVPFGITNVFALEVGIPLNPIAAAWGVLNGKPHKFDLGKANGRKFMLMCGVGLDALAVFHYYSKLKKFLNKYAYILAGVKVFFKYPLRPLRVTIVDQNVELVGYQVIVANCASYGGRMKIAPGARPDDGWLDVVVFESGKPLDVIRYVIGVIVGQHHRFSDVKFFKTKFVRIEGDAPYHLDSEPVGRLPLDVTIIPKAVNIILPRS